MFINFCKKCKHSRLSYSECENYEGKRICLKGLIPPIIKKCKGYEKRLKKKADINDNNNITGN